MSVYNKISIVVLIFLSLSHCVLDIFLTEKQVNHRDEYGLETPTNLQLLNFHVPEKAIKLDKKENNKDLIKFKRNYKTLPKFICIQMSCKNTLISDMSAVERSILGSNVSWDLKMIPTIERCPLQSVRYIEVLLRESDCHFIRS